MCHLLTDDWYDVKQRGASTVGDGHPHRAPRSSSAHALNRAVPGEELTIDILPDNMTRVVVSAATQCFI